MLAPNPPVVEGCLALMDGDLVPLEAVRLVAQSLPGQPLTGAYVFVQRSVCILVFRGRECRAGV